MPNPNSGETESAFVNRCIPIVMRDNPETDNKQAAAICYSKFRGESVHPDFQRIIGLFLKRYGSEGINKFAEFVLKNSLNISKMYNPKSQFRESFEWIEPLILPYKQDKEAKYYLVRALTANISMNNNDYGPYDRLEDAAPTLSWRPVNIDHDHNQWLPYPRTRTDFSNANEFSVEATLRVDNRDAWLQKMLDNKEILHPSIEGRPDPMGGYHFTGMALLRVGEELPGDPLTEILPLVFNESVGKSLCEFKDGRLVCECEKESKSEVKEKMSKTSEEEPKIECPEGQHYDLEIKKCVPDMEPETNEEKAKTIRDLQRDKSTLELGLANESEKYELLEATKQAEINTYKKQSLELKVKLEEATNQSYIAKGEITQLRNTVRSFDERLKTAINSQIETATQMTQESLKHQNQREGLEKQLQETQKITGEQTGLIEKQKVAMDNLVRQHKEVFEENARLSIDLTSAQQRELAWTKEKVQFTEDLNKALKHQKYLYEFLKKHNFEVVETSG